ncbi:DUF3261 domain-containing protein [Paraglaciecola arctica]|uniref:DUF3261 domain-containing protein n=1 Tax=Paraglaciecola arctica TaxID=1128911 RepID=UPI001C0799A1|nr:DUF3261 domain-containing protein [Paraglaciecola arctica]
MKILLLIAVMLLNACSSWHNPNTPIFLDKHSQFNLQPVPKALWGRSSLQKLMITTPQDKYELLLQTELLPNQINMVGLSAAGLVLFKLSWSQELGIQLKSNILAKEIDARVMLAYYQLANWPIQESQLGLQNLHINLSPKNQQRRDFMRGNALIFSMEHSTNSSLMNHYLDGYQIKIDTLKQGKIQY